jgi:hypothetical protein
VNGPAPAARPGPRRQPRAGTAAAEVARVLWAWRRQNGWRPGYVWDPFQGRYVPVARQTYWPSA